MFYCTLFEKDRVSRGSLESQQEIFFILCAMKKYFFGLIMIWAALGWGQENLRDIQRQIKTVRAEKERETQLHQQESSRHQSFLKAMEKKQANLQNQTTTLQQQIDSLKAEIDRLDESKRKAFQTVQWFESRRVQYQKSLANTLDSLVPFLAEDVPFKRQEDMESLQEIAVQLRQGTLFPEEALGRAFDLMMERIQMGFDTETWSGFLNVQHRTLPGKYVRYGAIAAVFVSQDGEEVFYLSHENDQYLWKEVSHDLQLRTLFKDALKVAEGKAPPSLVMLPFSGRVEVQP